MNYNSSKLSIESLMKKETVSAEELVETLNYVFDDVMDANNCDDVCDLKVVDTEGFIRKLNSLTRDLLAIYDANTGTINDLDESIKSSAQKVKTSLVASREALKKINQEVEDAQRDKNELEDVLKETTAQRGHLLTLKDECDALDAEITRLNDPFLDRLAEVVEGKRKEAAERKQKEQDLTLEFGERENELIEINAKITKISTDIATKQSEIDFAKASKEDLERQQATIDKLWNDSKELSSPELKEIQTKVAFLENCWNSYKDNYDFDNVLKAKFNNIVLDKEVFCNVNSVDEFIQAIDEIVKTAEQAVDAGLKVYADIHRAQTEYADSVNSGNADIEE